MPSKVWDEITYPFLLMPHYGWIPSQRARNVDPVCERVPVSNAWVDRLIASAVSHPDDIWKKVVPSVVRVSLFVAVSHPDDLWTLQYVIRMAYDVALCHPEDIAKFEHCVIRPNELAPGHISSGWLMANVLCHPDQITNLIPKWSGWLSYFQYLIRMTYGHCT